jgi:amino acid adenylation domain-containing protein
MLPAQGLCISHACPALRQGLLRKCFPCIIGLHGHRWRNHVLHRFTAPWLNESNYPLDWNGPADRDFAPFTDADMNEPIALRFDRIAGTYADRIAVDDGSRQLTYGRLQKSIRQLAELIAEQTKAGDLVGILLPSSVEYPAAMLACLACGRMFVPLDTHYPQTWISDVVEQSAMVAVICRSDDPQIASISAHICRIDVCGVGSGGSSPQPAGLDDPAFLLFTSGSTGRPKGIVNSQRNLLRRVAQYAGAGHINETDRFLPLSSECTIAGLRERLTALLTGGTLHLADVQLAGGREILSRLRNSEISIIYAVPALLRTLMQLGDESAPPSLRIVRVGGEAVLWSDVERLRHWLPADCRIQLGYSSTEAPIMQWFVPKDFPQEGSRVPLGYPLSGNALAIVDEDGTVVAPGEVGELVVRSPYVALGRWVDGRCSGEDFPTDPNDPACRILRTGDLVRLRSDGLIDLVGRTDRQIKIRGQRVEPGELEAQLRLQPGVRDAAVLPRQVGRNWWLIAYVVSDDRSDDVATRLKNDVRRLLPAPFQPQRIHLIEAIPRLASAKLDMKALQSLDEEFQRIETTQLPQSIGEAPRGKTELAVAEIWKRVLELDAVDRNADFFDLGGDSLMTLNLMFEIEDVLGVDLPVTMIYQTPTIASLSAALDARTKHEFAPLILVRKGTEGAPLFIVHGVGGNVMELVGVGRQIVSAGPVYAIQAKGLDGQAEPYRSITDMADYYLTSIREVFPEGPYHLAGYSSGGLIALEMAQMLRRSGESAASLTLIDTQTNARQWPLRIWSMLMLQRARHHAATAKDQTLLENLHLAARIAASLFNRILWRFGAGSTPIEPAPVRVPQALRLVHDSTLAAVADYRPARYDGPVTLIVPQIKDELMAPVEQIWQGNVGSLTVRLVGGDHRSMIQEEPALEVAEILSAVIAGAKAEPAAS